MHSTPTSSRKAWIAGAVLALAFATPMTIGFACLLAPRNSNARPEWVPVATLETLPAEGLPRKVPIVVAQFDASGRLPDEAAGYVFLRRMEEVPRVVVLRATNHAGCPVEFSAERRIFEDLCWDGRWNIDGHRPHSIPEWGDLQPVRTAVRGDVIFVNLNDAIP